MLEEETLDNQTYVLMYSRRDITEKVYKQKQEVILKGKHIQALQLKGLELYGADGVTMDEVQIAKHWPGQFKWEQLDPESKHQIKNKKGKQTKEVKLSEIELKQHPIQLKDGDEIGVRLLSEAAEDDWQTEQDKLLEAEFKANGGELREKGKNQTKKRGGDNLGIQNMAAWLDMEDSPLVA